MLNIVKKMNSCFLDRGGGGAAPVGSKQLLFFLLLAFS